ncbi:MULTISPECIES: hypothetical protein [Enterococcus]|uniref:Uncharacterized protein n=1 Tax=Enterococcus sulfureus ATCC 49903 TaxID=1140003 RepID=S0KS99_9ENTE|nr:hypothetical protein [Enterococcus sulfureus]EOT47669.1 hypothetical protein OMY_01043 [Enterococcus sulfureus ATCC 49903]EOT83910.1 hypothetical protein I573_01635 [Enterococcus sulfureus ATCC 49903]
MRDFEQELEELSAGTRTTLEVKRDEFLVFREIWVKREDREAIVGEAHQNGSVTYRYLPKV